MLDIVVVMWGGHVRTFQKWGLPSILRSPPRVPYRFVFYGEAPEGLDERRELLPGRKPHEIVQRCHRDANDRAIGSDSRLCFFCPDMVAEPGAFQELEKFYGGSVFTCVPRLSLEKYPEKVFQRSHCDLTVTNEVHESPSCLYWGNLAHCFHLHPILAVPREVTGKFDSVDGAYAETQRPYRVLRDFWFWELTSDAREFSKMTLDVKHIAHWARFATRPIHREFFQIPIGDSSKEHLAEPVWKEILNQHQSAA